MKKKICLMLLLGGLCSSSVAKDYLVSTPNTSLLITAVPGEKSKFQYYGSRIEERDIQGVYDSGQAFGVESYPVFGLNTPGETGDGCGACRREYVARPGSGRG